MRQQWPADLVATATEQAALRVRAQAKFTRAEAMLFTRHGLEQASSEATAQHRAMRFSAAQPALVIDLCCGIGGDLCALTHTTSGLVVGVDQDEAHALIARHNVHVHGGDAVTAVDDVHDVRLPRDAAVYVDPARRSAQGGTTSRGGYSPALEWCLSLAAERVAVKTAPGLAMSAVPAGWEAEFVAVGRDLKECVLWSPTWARASRRASVLPSRAGEPTAELIADPHRDRAPVRPPGRYLFDPSPAVTRAGAVADLAADLAAWQVDPRIAFLSADHPMRSPFGRGFAVAASLPFGLKPIAAELRRLDVGAVDIRRRGLAGDVEDLRRRLRLRGSRQATVMLTRVLNKPWSFICVDLDNP